MIENIEDWLPDMSSNNGDQIDGGNGKSKDVQPLTSSDTLNSFDENGN